MTIPATAGSPDVQPAAPAASPDATITPSAPAAADVQSAPMRVAPASAQVPQPGVMNPDAQKIVQEHHSALGAGMKRILGAIHGSYSTPTYDPQSGQIVDVPSPSKPGDIFRHIVAGAILGGAAANAGPSGEGFSGGFFRGGAAAMQKSEADRDKAFLKADANREAAIKQQKNADEHQYQMGVIAHYHTEEVNNAFNRHMMSQQYNDNHNLMQDSIEEGIKVSGGQIAQIKTPKGTVDGHFTQADYIRLHNADPTILNPIDGQHLRQLVNHTDTTGLHWDDKLNGEMGGWVDESGKPADLGSRTTVTLYDTPIDQTKIPHAFTGKQVSIAYDPTGKVKLYPDDAKVMLTLSELTSINEVGTKGLNEHLKGELEEKRMNAADKAADLAMARMAHLDKATAATESKTVLNDQKALAANWKTEIEADEKEMKDEYDPARKKMLQDRLDKRQGQLDELNARIVQNEEAAQADADAEAAAKAKKGGKGKGKAAPAAAGKTAAAPAAPDPDLAALNHEIDKAQATGRTPSDFDGMLQQFALKDRSDQMQATAAAKLGIPLPWAVVERMAVHANKKPEEMAPLLQQFGVKVLPKPASTGAKVRGAAGAARDFVDGKGVQLNDAPARPGS